MPKRIHVFVAAISLLLIVGVIAFVIVPIDRFYDLIRRQGDYIDERAEAMDGAFHIAQCLEFAHKSGIDTTGFSPKELSTRFGEHTNSKIVAERYPFSHYEIVHVSFGKNGKFTGFILIRAAVDGTGREFRFDFSKRDSTGQVDISPLIPED